VTEILFATEIAFRCLHRCVAQQELNLLQLASAAVAQLRTGSPQIVRRDMFQARSLAAVLHHVPHDILRDALPPHLSFPGDGSKDPSISDPGCRSPLIECCFHPCWNGDGAEAGCWRAGDITSETARGAYPITVTGTSGSLQHSIPLTLTYPVTS